MLILGPDLVLASAQLLARLVAYGAALMAAPRYQLKPSGPDLRSDFGGTVLSSVLGASSLQSELN